MNAAIVPMHKPWGRNGAGFINELALFNGWTLNQTASAIMKNSC